MTAYGTYSLHLFGPRPLKSKQARKQLLERIRKQRAQSYQALILKRSRQRTSSFDAA
jgi:hypothetical protein